MTDQEIDVSIAGAAEVITHYGQWPSFHDADLVRIDIDMRGPTVTIEFRLYDWDCATGKARRPRLVMAWRQVESFNLSGIDELGQNAVGSFKLSQPRGEEGKPIDTVITSTGTGTGAEIHAMSVQVMCFEPDEHWEYENIDSWRRATP